MGSGSWTTSAFADYSTTKGYTVNSSTGTIDTAFSVSQNYTYRRLADELNAFKKVRQCLDSDEHPTTIPVILALDVTGSMGSGAVEVAKQLNVIMTNLYAELTDVEFCIMGIGDVECDDAPIQMSQFESDIRIAEQLDKIYFEAGGGGNTYESYSAAWYMGLNHADLDCWKRGKKGIIITIGDEGPNPVLRVRDIAKFTGDEVAENVSTKTLLAEAQDKFNIYHLSVDSPMTSYSYQQKRYDIDSQWSELLGEDNYKIVNLNSLAAVISELIVNSVNTGLNTGVLSNTAEIAW